MGFCRARRRSVAGVRRYCAARRPPGAPEAWWTDPRVAVLELLQVRAPTRAEIKAWARAVRAEVTGFWLDVIAGLERALDISVPERPLQWTAIYWGTAVRSQIEEWAGRLWHGARSVLRFVATPEGLVYAAVAAGSALATGAMMVWALPAVTSMVAFQVRGSLNTFKQALSQNVRAQRGLLAAVIATLTVNIPHHIRGALTTAAPDANQWISGLFGVAAVTTVLGAIAMLAALINSRDSTVTFPKWWVRFTDRLETLGAAATLTAIPFMLYAVIVHPDYDGVVTIHPVVFALVVATFTGFGGEALLHLVGKAFKLTLPAKLTRFITVHSAVTIAAYGFLYQLRELLLLVVVTGGSTLAGLLYLVLTRPHLGPVEKIRHAALVTALTSINTLAATALFLGRPDMPTGSAIMAAVLGVAATVIWIWANRGPPGSDSGGPASPGGSALPGGGVRRRPSLPASGPRFPARSRQASAACCSGSRSCSACRRPSSSGSRCRRRPSARPVGWPLPARRWRSGWPPRWAGRSRSWSRPGSSVLCSGASVLRHGHTSSGSPFGPSVWPHSGWPPGGCCSRSPL